MVAPVASALCRLGVVVGVSEQDAVTVAIAAGECVGAARLVFI